MKMPTVLAMKIWLEGYQIYKIEYVYWMEPYDKYKQHN